MLRPLNFEVVKIGPAREEREGPPVRPDVLAWTEIETTSEAPKLYRLDFAQASEGSYCAGRGQGGALPH